MISRFIPVFLHHRKKLLKGEFQFITNSLSSIYPPAPPRATKIAWAYKKSSNWEILLAESKSHVSLVGQEDGEKPYTYEVGERVMGPAHTNNSRYNDLSVLQSNSHWTASPKASPPWAQALLVLIAFVFWHCSRCFTSLL